MATPIPSNQAAGSVLELTAVLGAGTHVGAHSSATSAYCGIVTDSRGVVPGNVFFAIAGEHFDGHSHVESAAAAGAAVIVGTHAALTDARVAGLVSRYPVTVLRVDDTVVALGMIAHAHLRRFRALDAARRVFVITGSSGKTTTKEMLAALLQLRGAVQKTLGNLNNRIGLPMTALTVTDAHRFVVLEAGMSVPGEMDALARIAEADVAAIVSVGLAHAEGVGGPDGIAHEKGAVFRNLKRTGTAVVCVCDARIRAQALALPQGSERVDLVAEQEPLDIVQPRARWRYGVIARRVVAEVRGAILTLQRGAIELTVRSPFVGAAHAHDLVVAWAMAEAAGVAAFSASELEGMLANLILDGRATVHTSAAGVTVIDDSYNANPESMRAALSDLQLLAGKRRKIAILGEMRELGVYAVAAHRRLGEEIVGSGVDFVIGCGGALIEEALLVAEAAGTSVLRARDAEHAGKLAQSLAICDDFVLVKASRGVRAERAVQALLP
jgi:UDP-N-acetylmuramoyl-tripeptide--D-alanyl-D-alanine ligase